MSDNPPSLVELHQVVKRYPHFTLDHLCLTLPAGEIMGLVGPNGAGKSTILKLLMGFISADGGSIKVLNRDISRDQLEIKQHTAYVSEEMRLYAAQTIAWHMRLMAKCFVNWDQAYALHILKRFELDGAQIVRHLSLGQRIKAALLLALARRPRLMILDEPSTGLDPVARHELTVELLGLMLDEHNSVIFSSQFTQDVERLSDTIAFIDHGTLISCQNKESYLDQWRRMELVISEQGSLPDGMYCMQQSGAYISAIDTRFTTERVAQLQQAGHEIRQLHGLTLEEIFIHQILIRRQAIQG